MQGCPVSSSVQYADQCFLAASRASHASGRCPFERKSDGVSIELGAVRMLASFLRVYVLPSAFPAPIHFLPSVRCDRLARTSDSNTSVASTVKVPPTAERSWKAGEKEKQGNEHIKRARKHVASSFRNGACLGLRGDTRRRPPNGQ